jgi:acetoin:2,6-dichlorophenolindophenol oxidoreductase subunit alpha
MERQLALDLYTSMMEIRLAEESFVQPILDGVIKCPVHLYTGQEAIASGLIHHLTAQDYVFGTHRSHGHFLAKGGTVQALVAEVYCRETGCSHGRGGSMHLIDPEVGMLGAAPIVGGTISLALGAGLATRVRGCGRVSVAFFGDGATGEGVLYEAMNFAAIHRLPVIFVCENNLYSTHMPIKEIRVDRPIAEVGGPFGVAAYRVDGNDVAAVHELAGRVVAESRAGGGPAFIECLTYRMRGHVGPNDNIQGTQTDIRPAAEVTEWQSRDPIARLEREILAAGTATADDLAAIRARVAKTVDDAHVFARASAFPDPAELERYVFQS